MSPRDPETRANVPSSDVHPLPRAEAGRLADQAWEQTFVQAMGRAPHPDKDPDGRARRAAQREHLACLVGQFGVLVAHRAVAAGLCDSVEAFMEYGEAECQRRLKSDPL